MLRLHLRHTSVAVMEQLAKSGSATDGGETKWGAVVKPGLFERPLENVESSNGAEPWIQTDRVRQPKEFSPRYQGVEAGWFPQPQGRPQLLNPWCSENISVENAISSVKIRLVFLKFRSCSINRLQDPTSSSRLPQLYLMLARFFEILWDSLRFSEILDRVASAPPWPHSVKCVC